MERCVVTYGHYQKNEDEDNSDINTYDHKRMRRSIRADRKASSICSDALNDDGGRAQRTNELEIR